MYWILLNNSIVMNNKISVRVIVLDTEQNFSRINKIVVLNAFGWLEKIFCLGELNYLYWENSFFELK